MKGKEFIAATGVIGLTAFELLTGQGKVDATHLQTHLSGPTPSLISIPTLSTEETATPSPTPLWEGTMLPSETPSVDLEHAAYQLKTENGKVTSVVINGQEYPITMLDVNAVIVNYAYNPSEIKPKWGITDKHIEAPAGGSRKEYKQYAITGIFVGADEAQITAQNPKDGSMVPLNLDRVYLLIPVSGGFVKARIYGLDYEGVKRAEEIRGPNLNRFGISHGGYGWKVYNWSDIKNMLAQGDQVIVDVITPPQGGAALEKYIQTKLNNGVGYEDFVAQMRAYNALYPDNFKKLRALRPDPKGAWIDVPGLAQITVPIKL